MLRSHKIRLNPTPEQAVYFRKACGTSRYAYNWGLAQIKASLDRGEKPATPIALKKQFNAIKSELCPWVYEVTKCAAAGGFRNLAKATANYYSSKQGKRKSGRVGFPKFKSKKYSHQSFYLDNDKFKVSENWLTVPKLGRVNMTETLRFTGKIMSGTVSYHAGHWWISITVELPDEVRPNGGEVLGVDVGIKTLATCSDGTVFENQKHLKSAMRKLKRLDRAVSRKVKGSVNRRKAADKLARAHYRVACRRQDAIHKMTTSLVRRAAVIGIEDLNVAGMIKNHRLAQAISDASFSEIVRQLVYKGASSKSAIIKVPRFYPSSKLHNVCGVLNDGLTLADRVWTCPGCGGLVDRDLNAAQNIRDEAMRILASHPVVATSGG